MNTTNRKQFVKQAIYMLEIQIRTAINRYLEHDHWTIDDIHGHGDLIVRGKTSTVIFDGVPLLEFEPVVTMVDDDGHDIVVQHYRHLYPNPQPASLSSSRVSES
jgi:hypothetical protein